MDFNGGFMLMAAMLICSFLLFFSGFSPMAGAIREVGIQSSPSPPVKLDLSTTAEVVMKNGIVEITLTSPGGDVIGIKYNGINNLLDDNLLQSNRGYYDIVWKSSSGTSSYDKLQGTKFNIVRQTDDVLEVSFSRRWRNGSSNFQRGISPLNLDKRYVMLRGSSGFYTYIVLEHQQGWPDFGYGEARTVYKLSPKKFLYMALSDKRQRYMPTSTDRAKGKPLAYPEAVLLPSGEVDDKYQYSANDEDIWVHGWICDKPATGFWLITPSDEYRTCGPMKQDLTSHVGPTALGMFISNHYAGRSVDTFFRNGERWKKVFGPIMIYLNSASSPGNNTTHNTLWDDAKRQMHREVESWPYNFTSSDDFPPSSQRGAVAGRLKVSDRYLIEMGNEGKSAHVGLAAPGDVGSWQRESKGYQFWTHSDKQGNFVIKNVRAGTYNLYAWVPGVLGDYKYQKQIEISPGSRIQLGDVVYSPPRQGQTLWEIGVPDRSAAEFYVPDPYAGLVNKLYLNDNENKFRQYGLWEKYTELYPKHDLIYNVGVSNYRKDWFYAHVLRNKGNNTYLPTTWQIRFRLRNVDTKGHYTLQVAIASATRSNLEFRFNNSGGKPYCSTGTFGTDNAIARHGIHGLYWFFSFLVEASVLHQGTNTIYITQLHAENPFQGVMYDYIRLEGPPLAATT